MFSTFTHDCVFFIFYGNTNDAAATAAIIQQNKLKGQKDAATTATVLASRAVYRER